MNTIVKQYLKNEIEFTKINNLVDDSLKRRDQQIEKIKTRLAIPLDELIANFRDCMLNFMEHYQDADELDFINEEITRSEQLLKNRSEYNLCRSLSFSREKYLRFLQEEKEFAHNNIKNLEQGSHLYSNGSRIDVAYFMLLGFQLRIFRFHSENDLALFIERNCTYDGGKKMKSVRQLLHNIRKDNIKTDHIKQKYLDYFDSLGR
jgi:hypothetical protein